MSKRKKLATIFVIVSTIILSFVLYKQLNVNQAESFKSMVEINSKDFIVILRDESEKSNFIVGSDTCGACRRFIPVLNQVLVDSSSSISYLDIDSFSSREILEELNINQTPTIITKRKSNVYTFSGVLSPSLVKKILNYPFNEESIIEVTYEELVEIEKSSTDFILYIGRDDCPDCQAFMPVLLQNISQSGKLIFYLNIRDYRLASLKENATQKEKQIYEELKSRYTITWVPLVLHMKNSREFARYEFLDEEYYTLTEEEKKEEFQRESRDFAEWLSKNS